MKKAKVFLSLFIPVFLINWFYQNPPPKETPQQQSFVTAPPPCNCTLTQGNFSAPLPFMSSNTSAVNFYAYGNPVAASANTGLELSETLLLMLYEDTNTGNTSLIIILDQANDPTGGDVDLTVNCLPDTAFVGLQDDPGELFGVPPTITGDFFWSPCCTDGGIIGGVGCGNTITINPTINSGVNFFSLVYGTPTNPTYVNMPDIQCPITINCGGISCCDDAFEFSATTQNASCEDSGNGSIDLSTNCATTPSFQWSTGATTEDLFNLDPGTYFVTITDINGCMQSDFFTILADAPSPQPNITGPTEYCEGEFVILGVTGTYTSYQWSTGDTNPSLLVNTPGTYSVTVTNAAGCTGTASTTIGENPTPVPMITGPTNICFGETVTLDAGGGFATYAWSTGENTQAIDISEVGGYSVTVTNSFGCTGFDFLVVQPNPVPTPVIFGPSSICEGEPANLDAGSGFDSYNWSTGEMTQTISVDVPGDYSVTVTNEFDCEGIGTWSLSENSSDTTFFFQTSCNPLDTGVFETPYVNQSGCDSLVILTIDFNTSDSVFLTGQSCNPADTGIFVQSFINQFGCDSIVTELISLLPSDSSFIFDSSCSPLDTGTVVEIWPNQFGCDSTVTTFTSLLEADSTFLFDTTCDPSAEGVSVETLTATSGCDSIVTTTINLLPSDTTELMAQSCDPAEVGISEEVLINSFGCDSLVITTTALVLIDTTELIETTCDPAETGISETLLTGTDGCDSLIITHTVLLVSDTTYLQTESCDPNQVGQTQELLSNQNGCDSLIITTTSLLPSDTTLLFDTNCDPNQVGQTQELLSNQNGCDSLIITTTSLLPSDTTNLLDTSCDPNQVGIIETIFSNQFGCDSLVITETIFSESDSTSVQMTTCDPSQTGEEVDIFTNSEGCDSIVTTITNLLPSDTTFLMASSCNPSDVGISQQLLNNQFGCDSLIIITTSLIPADTTFLTASSCDPLETGIFESLLMNNQGCDSLVITTIQLLPSDTTFLDAFSCEPNETGISTALLDNQFGCDSLIITTTNLLLSDTTYLSGTSCNPAETGEFEELLSNQNGCDSLVLTTINLLPSDTTYIQDTSCDPGQTGVFTDLLTNQFGCDSLIITTVNLLTSDTTYLSDVSCNPAEVGTFEELLSNQNGCDSLLVTTINLLPTDTTLIYLGSCSPLDTGIILTTLINQFGCDSLVFEQTDLLPPSECQLNGFAQGDTIGCNDPTGSAWITLFDGTAPYSYTWVDQDGNMDSGQIDQTGIPQSIENLLPGIYTINLNDPGGFSSEFSFQIFQLDPIQFSLQIVSDFNGFDISCFEGTDGIASAEIIEGGQAPYSFQWSNGSFSSTANNLGAGWISLTVTGNLGCTTVDSIFLSEPESLNFSLLIDHPDCFSEGLGTLSITDATGGVSPYQYSLNGGNWQSNPQFGGLSSGSYLLEMEDANGCTVSSFAFINSFIPLEVSLGTDTSIQWGDSILLQPILNVPFALLDSLYWNGIDCPDCTEVIVAPLVTSTYSVTLIDSLGCTAGDALSIDVEKNFKVYIPNAFSPDFDGINDGFTIFGGPELTLIKELRIFNRWGEPVFSRINLPPNQPQDGWDGTFRGQRMDPAVFTYFAVLEFVDGTEEFVKGDVLLMR